MAEAETHRSDASGAERLSIAAAWCAAGLGFVFALAAFFPGYMSWDSAYQWWQARHDSFDATHPPLLAMIWQFTDRVLPGPGGMFVLQQALLWSAYAYMASVLPWRGWQRVLLVLLLGLWPPLLGLSAHVWKDLWTLAGFAWAMALLLHECRHPSRGLRLLVFLAVAAACAFRLNAISGALPFMAWLTWRELSIQPPPLRMPVLALGTIGSMLLLTWVSMLPNHDARVRRIDSVWSVVTLWDAAGVSLREGRLVYPKELVAPDLGLDELREVFADFSNTTVFQTGKLKHSFDGPYTDDERAALRRLAWQLPTCYPQSYFAHRLRLAELLYGFDRQGLPDHQVFSPGLHPYGDNPTIEARRSRLHDWVQPHLQRLIDTPLFAGWIYLLAAAVGAAWAWRRRQEPLAVAALVAGVSALAYALPLALASGSAEFRYLAWPLSAALLTGALLLVPATRPGCR